MASTLPSTSNKSKIVKRRLITSVWFIMALLASALTLSVWIFSSAPAFQEKSEVVNEPTVEETVLNIGQINHIDDIKQLEDAVQPISFDTLVRDLRNYPPEFKDFKYLKANEGKWTVQVMDVSEHEVVTDYLSTRKDRAKFAYFRYRDSNNQARYLLTYGIMSSPQMAMGAAKTVDFALPANVRVLPEEIDRYLDIIENYELSTEKVKDLSSDLPREVKLQPAKKELVAKKNADDESKDISDESLADDQTSTDKDTEGTRDTNSEDTGLTETEIKGSKDTSQTLSVVEDRGLVDTVDDDKQKVNQPKPPKKPDTTVAPSKPTPSAIVEQPPIPVKPESAKPAKPNPTASSQSGNGRNDAIKELIDAKTE